MLTTDTILQKAAIKRDQTAIDFALQYSGGMESLFDVLLLNGIGATDDVAPGTVLQAPVVDKKVIGFYAGSVFDIITIDKSGAVPGGIGYMQIGTSFKVS